MANGNYSATNWNQPPHNRQSFQHMADLFTTRNVAKSSAPCRPLEQRLQDLSSITYPVSGGQRQTLEHYLANSFTDAFLVLQDGVVVTEEYRNNMQASTPHLLNSVSKSFVGMLAGTAVEEGLLETSRLISDYLPELKETGFSQTTVQNALDMTSAIAYSEDYDEREDDFWHEAAVVGWRPDLKTASSPAGLLEYFQQRTETEQAEGEHFHYRTVLTNICAAVIQRAVQMPFVDYLTLRLWQPMGPEHNANVVMDAQGLPYMGAGMSACARDLARFGEMLRNDGFYNDQQILPVNWVQGTRLGNERLRELFAASDYSTLLPKGHYHNQVWADAHAGELMCIGIHGQHIYINQPKSLVCVKLSSHPYPTDLGLYGETNRALRALAAEI